MQCSKERSSRYHIENRELILKRRRERIALTKEQRRLYASKYWKEHKALARELCAKRKARKLNAMPKWVDNDAIRIIYDAASSLGKDYHVDHIVPLYNPEVCGLHVPWNLRIVPAAQNISKHNSFDPETPCGYHPDTYKILMSAGVEIPKDLVP